MIVLRRVCECRLKGVTESWPEIDVAFIGIGENDTSHSTRTHPTLPLRPTQAHLAPRCLLPALCRWRAAAARSSPCDMSVSEPHHVELDDACRQQQLGEGWFYHR